MITRILGALLAVLSAVGLLATATSATARPRVPDRPHGLTVAQARHFAEDGPHGDCAISGVHCKPHDPGLPISCTGADSKTPPASIRVYDPTFAGANHIRVVPFETYVENVLPNEWVDTYDGDSLKAGAVAVTSYAWYWAIHYGGYVGTATSQTCFDVTTDDNFQVYKFDSAKANSTSKVQQVFPSAIRRNGAVIEASYLADLNPRYDPTAAHPVLDTCGQDADGSTLSQDGSQACNEDNTANKWPVILKLYYGQDIELASTQQLRTQHDFQYLRRSTQATFNAGTWSINDGYPTSIRFGLAGDVPVVNTVGDGFARVGVYRPSNRTWYLGGPTGLPVATTFQFGLAGDVPVAAQYKGLGAATQVAVWRPSNGTWYFAGPSGGTASTIQYGVRGDIPVPGRWLSANQDSPAVFRPSTSTWYIRGGSTVHYGLKGDIPVPADYDGNGTTDIAVWRPSTREFYVRGQAAVHWGLAGDIPVTGDFTGDGKADLAVYRPSSHTFYVRGGSSLPAVGSGSAIPIGKAPYRD